MNLQLPQLRAQESWYLVTKKITGPVHTTLSCGLEAGGASGHKEANMMKRSEILVRVLLVGVNFTVVQL